MLLCGFTTNIMSTLKSIISAMSNNINVEFRLNDKPDSKGTLWANGFVQNRDNMLVCIGATQATLEALQADPKRTDITCTTLKPMKTEKGREYLMCQLGITDKPADFSFSLE